MKWTFSTYLQMKFFKGFFLNCIANGMHYVDFIETFNISFFLWASSLGFRILAK
jgi:hypothetical protein